MSFFLLRRSNLPFLFLFLFLVFDLFLGWQYWSLKSRKNLHSPTEVTKTTHQAVTAVSDVAGYRLAIENQTAITNYLDRFGFWQEGVFSTGEGAKKIPRTLTVHLTSQEQPFLKHKAQGEIVYSMGEKWEQDNFHLYLYLKEIPETSGGYLGFDRLFLDSVYTLTQGGVQGSNNPGEFESIFSEFRDRNISLFKIAKTND